MDVIIRWFEGLPHFFRRLPVVAVFAWRHVQAWFTEHLGWVHEVVREFVRIGWDFMLVVTVCTFLLVLSRLIPRRTR
jgi:hypothetical protein